MTSSATAPSSGRNIVVVVVPGSCDSPFLMQWTAGNFFHRQSDTLHLVTGAALNVRNGDTSDASLERALDKTLEDWREEERTVGRPLPDDISIVKTVLPASQPVAEALEAYVKKVQANALVIDSQDLSDLKRTGHWAGSFSGFCSHHIHCHVIVVSHPHHEHARK